MLYILVYISYIVFQDLIRVVLPAGSCTAFEATPTASLFAQNLVHWLTTAGNDAAADASKVYGCCDVATITGAAVV